MNPTLPTYFLHILQGQRSNAQVLIFVLNSLREAEFFIEFGRRSHHLGAREERLFESRILTDLSLVSNSWKERSWES